MTSKGKAPRLPAGGARSWLAESSWPYGLLLVAGGFGLGLLLLGVALQAWLWPASDRGALLEARIPAAPGRALPPIPREPLDADSAAELRERFARQATGSAGDPSVPTNGAAGVPPLALQALPDDLADLPDPEERKALFLQSVLPLVLMANRGVRRVREQVEAVAARRAAGEAPSAAEAAWLDELAGLYGSEPGDLPGLLERLDVVPVPIALAQAALETGWGTSRFALQGHALFGARTWRDDQDGLVPAERAEGERYRVRSFAEPAESVWSYLHNLNTSPAYAEWRAKRAALRAAGTPLTAEPLLDGLVRYSEQGADYVALLRRLIETERLTRFAGARLAQPAVETLAPAAGAPLIRPEFLMMP